MINNLNILLPEIFLTVSIFSILMIGVFIKNSFNLIFNLTSLIILLTIAIILNSSNNVEKIFLESFTRDSFSNNYWYARGGKANSALNNRAQNGANSVLIDIENVSTYGIYFNCGSHASGSYTQGSAAGAWNSNTPMYTTLMFERMGDT